jgi:hypothetical protein
VFTPDATTRYCGHQTADVESKWTPWIPETRNTAIYSLGAAQGAATVGVHAMSKVKQRISKSPAPAQSDDPRADFVLDNTISVRDRVGDLLDNKDPSTLLLTVSDTDLDMPVAQLGLHARLEQKLTNHNILTIRDLRQYTYRQLLAIPPLYRRDVDDLIASLRCLEAQHASILPDIAAMLGRIPAKILSGPIDYSSLDSASEIILIKNGVVTIEDLRMFSTTQLLSLPGVTDSTVLALTRYIRQLPQVLLLEQTHTEDALPHHPVPKVSTDSFIECCLQTLQLHHNPNKLWSLLVAYWGQSKTLTQAAVPLKIGKERACQLIAGFSRALGGIMRSQLESRLATLYKDRREPLYVNRLGQEDPWFSVEGNLPPNVDPGLFVARAIVSILDRYYIIKLDDHVVLSPLSQSRVRSVMACCLHSLLESRTSLNRQAVESIIMNQCQVAGAPELAKLIFVDLNRSLHWSKSNGEPILASGPTTIECVIAVLGQCCSPLSVQEITDRCTTQFKRPFSVGTIRNVLPRCARHRGRNLWALLETHDQQ